MGEVAAVIANCSNLRSFCCLGVDWWCVVAVIGDFSLYCHGAEENQGRTKSSLQKGFAEAAVE